MDCNREEAIRAKSIAEKKMESKDFLGARKIALKAQLLYPGLENISQMLFVCDVHCFAAKKLAGNDLDYYGILQVEKTADEVTIKKQYKKFALQLHPDKNKFPGAEGAFKMITEAQGNLLDKDKRRQHDMKHGASLYRPPHSGNWNANLYPSTNRSHPSAPFPQNMQPHRPSHPGHPDPNVTFWTCCPFCSVKYQYFKDVMLRSLRCQSCHKPFIAYDMFAPSTANLHKPVFPQTNNTYKVEVRVQPNKGTGNSKPDPGQNAGLHRSTPDVGAKVNHGVEKSRVRKRNQVSDSESASSDSESSEEEIEVDENGDLKPGNIFSHPGSENVRRSSRQKQQVSYKENLSDGDNDDEDEDRASKRAKGKRSDASNEEENGNPAKDKSAKMANGHPHFVAETKEDEKVELKEGDKENVVRGRSRETLNSSVEGQLKGNFEDQRHEKPGAEAKEKAKGQFFSYPDAEFTNFDKDRVSVECFEAGQTWAVYDDHDAMPRFYVKIRKVLSPGVQIVITWLDPDPDDSKEIKWARGDLPFSCGKFKIGNTDKTDNLPMFSHKVYCTQGNSRNNFVILPRKGETWAIFKNWDIKWSRDPVTKRKNGYEYEYVEVLSNYVDGVGIHAALLSKLDGFVSLFDRTTSVGKRTVLIPPNELLRFSHMIPSSKMKGKDKIPEGSFELDPASLPAHIFKSSEPKPDPECKVKQESDCESDAKKRESQSTNSSVPTVSVPEEIEYPAPQFHDFDAAKSRDKFQLGQVWALYSDEDGYPKYYCTVEKIENSPAFSLHVSWLAGYALDNVNNWSDRKIPISCGWFKIKNKKKCQVYDTLSAFSHVVATLPRDNDHFSILPEKEQVWAMYRNWNPDIKVLDLVNCEYDIVEVLPSDDDSHVRVLELERVAKYNSVFKPRVKEGSMRSVSRVDILRFSHQIPGFRFTADIYGKLRGFWELDPAAVPIHYFRS